MFLLLKRKFDGVFQLVEIHWGSKNDEMGKRCDGNQVKAVIPACAGMTEFENGDVTLTAERHTGRICRKKRSSASRKGV